MFFICLVFFFYILFMCHGCTTEAVIAMVLRFYIWGGLLAAFSPGSLHGEARAAAVHQAPEAVTVCGKLCYHNADNRENLKSFQDVLIPALP